MDAAGKLACPDDQPGRDEVTLSEGNAAHAAEGGPVDVPTGGGNYQPGDDFPVVHATTAEEAGF